MMEMALAAQILPHPRLEMRSGSRVSQPGGLMISQPKHRLPVVFVRPIGRAPDIDVSGSTRRVCRHHTDTGRGVAGAPIRRAMTKKFVI
jgi:hypothetical protein